MVAKMMSSAAFIGAASEVAVGGVGDIDDRHDRGGQQDPQHDPCQDQRHSEDQRFNAVEQRSADQNADEGQHGQIFDECHWFSLSAQWARLPSTH